MIRICAVILCLIAAPLTASADDTPIAPDEWRKLTVGRTVYYYIGGTFFGREYYWPGTDMVTFQHSSGICADARWSYHDGIYCFYFDRPHCFSHVRRAEGIVIIPDNPESEESGREQEVRLITKVPFSCKPGLTS